MERLRSIRELEEDFRRHGSFLLVMDGRIKFYGRKTDAIAQLAKELSGRCNEMIKFLTALSECKGRDHNECYVKTGA